MANIEVRIGKDGRIRAETHDLKGPDCLPYIAKLERALAARTVRSEYTDEFYEAPGVAPAPSLNEARDEQAETS